MRPARPEDVPAIQALVERAYGPYVPVIGRRPAPMDDDVAARIALGHAHVLERDGVVVALAVVDAKDDHLWIEDLAVDPALHGRGIGRALLAFCEAEARRRGLPELRLLTNERMTRNLTIYARAGFEETDRREEDGFRRVFLRKLLR